MMTFLLVLTVLASLLAAAFFAGAETGFLSVSRGRVLHLAREGGRKALLVQKALSDMSHTTTTLLIGNNLSAVCYTSASSALILALCHDSTGQAVCSLIAAFLVLYVSEFLPKLMCAARPLRRILALAPYYRVAETALRPLTRLALALTGWFLPGQEAKNRLTATDIVRILEDRQDGVCLSSVERALLGHVVSRRVSGKSVTPESLLDALRADL